MLCFEDAIFFSIIFNSFRISLNFSSLRSDISYLIFYKHLVIANRIIANRVIANRILNKLLRIAFTLIPATPSFPIKNEDFIKLLKLTTERIFLYNNKTDRQTDGVTVGSPLGADLGLFLFDEFRK